MKKITAKLILISFAILVLTSMLPNIFMVIFGEDPTRPNHFDGVTSSTLFLVAAGTTITTITLYSFAINRIVLKRIKRLTNATKEVMNGNLNASITERGQDEISQLIHNFNLMTAELKSNEYLNKEFVRNFSHELKTPLSAIKGYAELMNHNTVTEKEKTEYAQIIIDESKRLSTLSRNMLLISQVDNQVIVPKNDTFNITEQLRNIIQLMQIEWERKKLDFDLDVEEVKLVSNKELTYQIFSNLLSNAIKFAPVGSTLSMKLYDTESDTHFEITNEGSLSQEECERVFDLFYIKDKSRSSKSNGVGLSLTKKIVEKLEGDIKVTSNNNKITFKLQLNK